MQSVRSILHRVSPQVLLLACLTVVPIAALEAGVEGAIPSPEAPSYGVPWSVSVPVDLAWDTGVPEPAVRFAETAGTEWILYWDYTSETPRLLRPRREYILLDTEGFDSEEGEAQLESSLREFLTRDGSAGLFGIEPGELGPALVIPMKSDRMLVFPQQTRDGLPVRGANLRAWVADDGRLLYVKAYLARAVSDRAAPFLDVEGELLAEADARALLPDEQGSVTLAHQEIVFPAQNFDHWQTAWCLRIREPDERVVEQLRDARNGNVLRSARIVKHLEGVRIGGQVICHAPDLNNIYSHPDSPMLRVDEAEDGEPVEQPIPGAIITRVGDGDMVSVANSVGRFAVLNAPEEGLLRAHLVYAPENALWQIERFTLRLGTCISWNARYIEFQVRARQEFDRQRPCLEGLCLPADVVRNPLFSENVVDCSPDRDSPTPEIGRIIFNQNYEEAAAEWQDDAENLNWWLLIHTQGARMFDAAHASLDELVVEGSRFEHNDRFRFERVEVRSLLQDETLPGAEQIGLGNWELLQSPELMTSAIIRTTRMVTQGEMGPVPRMASQVGHEFGHHLTWAITQSEAYTETEEAVADALVMIANDDGRIGYQGPEDRGPFGYDFGDLSRRAVQPAFITRTRELVGRGLFSFHLGVRTVDRRGMEGSLLLHRWLFANQVLRGFDRSLEDGFCIVDELTPILARLLEGAREGDVAALYQRVLRNAFRDSIFHRGNRYIRGDANQDGSIDISDASTILEFLFAQQIEFVVCADAHDVDDSNQIDISDPIYLLRHLFLGGSEPPRPYPNCEIENAVEDGGDGLCCIEPTANCLAAE